MISTRENSQSFKENLTSVTPIPLFITISFAFTISFTHVKFKLTVGFFLKKMSNVLFTLSNTFNVGAKVSNTIC